MNILVVNTGSSSLKYQLIDMENERALAVGLCERIGMEKSIIKHTKCGNDAVVVEKDMKDHKVAIKAVIDILMDKELGAISNMNEISAVGHRVVHGGEKFIESVLIDEKVMKALYDSIELAPLHNPPNIIGIEACKEVMPNTPMVAVFDTAFHHTIPELAYLYALPYELYEKYGIRKYGFHGTSHKYVAERAAAMLGKPLNQLKLISCHLGNGASICAIKNGESLETSMGFTPLAGLAMGTRSGNIDPAIIKFIMEKENMNIEQVGDILNKKSGMLGISGLSSDFRDLHKASEEGNKKAKLAIDIFAYRVKRFVGEYISVLNGVDAIIFTAGIGENDAIIREQVLEDMSYFGIQIDKEKNKQRGKEIDITTAESKTRVLVIPTNEELAIARETKVLMK